MLPSTYDEQDCAVARALEAVGERWTLLIVRDALLGVRRFEDFQSRLGLSRAVLSDRLAGLTGSGVLERVRYQQRPDRHEYLLTSRGLGLWPVVAALAQWGESLQPGPAPRRFRHHSCPAAVRAQVTCPDCGAAVHPAEVMTAPAAGAAVSRSGHLRPALCAELSRERPLLAPVAPGS